MFKNVYTDAEQTLEEMVVMLKNDRIKRWEENDQTDLELQDFKEDNGTKDGWISLSKEDWDNDWE